MIKVHVIFETAFKGNGVHSAFVEHMELLNSREDVETVINNKGTGDVLHSHTYTPYYFIKGLRYKNRRVFTAHVIPDSIKGSLPGWKFLMPFIKWYLKKVYSYSDVCIAISPRVEEVILESGAKTRIERIYNPLSVEKWQSTPEKQKKGREMLGLSDNEFVVLGVGQLIARKGVEDFMDIAKAVPEARFVWAGGRPFGLLTEGIFHINSRMAESQGSNIQYTGMLGLDQMPLIYAAADMMLFPSYQENCPLAPIEGAASGLPVVFRDIMEYQSLYEHPYLKAANAEEFIQLTRRLMTDTNFYKQGQDISKLLITQFDKNVISEKLINLYKSLLTTDMQTSAPKFSV